MSKGSYLGGSTVIKTFGVGSRPKSTRLKTPTHIEVKQVSKTGERVPSQAEIEAEKSRRRQPKPKVMAISKKIKNLPKAPGLKEPSGDVQLADTYTNQQITAYILKHFPHCPRRPGRQWLSAPQLRYGRE